MKPRVFLADHVADGAAPRGPIVAVVPAARMRTLSVAIPPAAADKLDAVVRFALEDQLASDIDAQHVVIAARRASDVLVHVIDRRWLTDALDRLGGRGTEITRAVAESDVAPRDDTSFATWIHRADGGFLIERSGKVTMLDMSGDALPSGLLLALDRDASVIQGSVAGGPRIVVHGPASLDTCIDAWTRATGAQFERRPEWSSDNASEASIDAAPDLLTPALRRSGAARIQTPRSPWRPAVAWLAAALALQIAASAIDWGSLQWRVARLDRETEQAIRGAAPELADGSATAWRAHYASFRHRSGKAAPDDALPMLADASQGLREIGVGAVRTITFEAGQLTLDIERSAASALAAAIPRWADAGLSTLQADTPAGIRIRLARE